MLVLVPQKAIKYLESALQGLDFLLGIMEGKTKEHICVTVCGW